MQILNTLTVLALVVMSFALIVAVPVLYASNEDSGRPVSFDDLQYFRAGSKMALGLLLTPMKSLVPRTRTQCKHFLSRFSALLCAGYKGTQIERPSTLQHWTGG